MENPISLQGLAFLEFSTPQPEHLKHLFEKMGFQLVLAHSSRPISIYKQNEIVFILNEAPDSFAAGFARDHGPCISAMGWLVADAPSAAREASRRGSQPASGDYEIPAVHGIGGSLIYFIDGSTSLKDLGFIPQRGKPVIAAGLNRIDHLTNNVAQGTLHYWADFYKNTFGFTEIRYFDIKGKKTGLHSFALRSPCGTFSIPINEGTESKSQINEYLREYQGPGIQHVALSSENIIATLEAFGKGSIPLLDIEPSYYDDVFKRVPGVKEDKTKIRDLGLLVDGDEKGYLLQIFSKNLIGPIFFEFIQRRNHHSFGEGNFGALFRSIERDQEKRGAL